MYIGDQVSSNGGDWLSGAGDARIGLMRPGRAALEAKPYQEVAPGIALERVRIIRVREALVTAHWSRS